MDDQPAVVVRRVDDLIFQAEKDGSALRIWAYTPDKEYGREFNQSSVRSITPLLDIEELFLELKETERSALSIVSQSTGVSLKLSLKVGKTQKYIKLLLADSDQSQEQVKLKYEEIDIELRLRQISEKQQKNLKSIEQARIANKNLQKQFDEVKADGLMHSTQNQAREAVFSNHSRRDRLLSIRNKQKSFIRRLQTELEELKIQSESLVPNPFKRNT